MTIIFLTVIVIALTIAILAIFLFTIGVTLKRTADDLVDCLDNVKTIRHQAEGIGPAIERINQTGSTVVGAMPLLCEGAENVAVAKSAPYSDPHDPPVAVSAGAPSAEPPVAAAAPSAVPPQGVGYLDEEGRGEGYLDKS
jgi:hypothetical protein